MGGTITVTRLIRACRKTDKFYPPCALLHFFTILASISVRAKSRGVSYMSGFTAFTLCWHISGDGPVSSGLLWHRTLGCNSAYIPGGGGLFTHPKAGRLIPPGCRLRSHRAMPSSCLRLTNHLVTWPTRLPHYAQTIAAKKKKYNKIKIPVPPVSWRWCMSDRPTVNRRVTPGLEHWLRRGAMLVNKETIIFKGYPMFQPA